MPEYLLPGNVINRTTGLSLQHTPFGTVGTIVGVADITTTPATVFDLKERSGNPERPDGILGSVPLGATLFYVGFRIPDRPAITAVNGDRLKLATAVGATGAQAFDAAGATSYVASAAAAGTTFAPAQSRFSLSPYAGTAAALSAGVVFRLFNDNGTTGAGSGLSVPSGSAQIICVVKYVLPGVEDIPLLANIPAKPNRA
jgi:hypothetical protein